MNHTTSIDWCKALNWEQEQLEDIRNAGYAYLRQGKYDIALSFFEALIALNPENPFDCHTLGALHMQLGNPTKAIKYLDKTLKLEADHTLTLLNLSKAFFMLGRKEEGLRIALVLQREKDPYVSGIASALVLAYEIQP